MPFFNRSGPRGRFMFFPFIAVAMALILGLAVMFLWNMTLPELLHASRISYRQAIGLLLLCRILFGNFRPGRGGGPGMKIGRHQWRDKLMHMSAEEREKFREEWLKRRKTKAQ